MKRKNLKLLSIILSSTMIFGTVLPTSAYNLDENNNSVESVEYQNTTDEDFKNKANVFAQLGSEYKVTIPKIVVLSGATKDARYYVKVAGDIAGYEKVNVVPEDSFRLSAKNKDSQTAKVVQDKTTWTVHDFDTDANGQISADGITAGKWQGKFNFNINLESDDVSVLPEEKVLGDLIIPDASEWKGQILQDIYIMKVGDIDVLKATDNNKDISDLLEITSSNEDVVKTENKQLEAVGIGQTTITTVYEDKSFSAKIKVVEPETPAHIHTAGEAVRENEIAATCTENGSYEEVVYCIDCGEEISRLSKTIETIGHDWELSVTNEATCELDSLEAYVCKKCCETDIQHNIKATGHIADISKDMVTAPTCTSQGYTVHTCKKCGKTWTDTIKEELGHNYVNGKCTRCNDFDMSKMEAGLYSVDANKNYTLTTSWQQIIDQGWYTVNNGKLIQQGINYATGVCAYTDKIAGFLVIPETVTALDTHVFYSAHNLTGFYIPKSVKEIDFFNTTAKQIDTIIVDKNNTSFKSINGALYNCDGTKIYLAPRTKANTFVIEDTCKEISSYTFAKSKFEEIVLPESIEKIGNYAFRDMENIASLYIPSNTTTLGEGIATAAYKIEEINVASDNKNYTSSDGIVFSKDLKQLIICPSGKKGSYDVPNTVTTINTSGFNGCRNLTSITIPDSVTSIGNWVFSNCSQLTNLRLSKNITRINVGTFSGASNLKVVTIPAKVTYIGEKNCNVWSDNGGRYTSFIFEDTTHKWKAKMMNGGKVNNTIPTSSFSVADPAQNAKYMNNSQWYFWTRE